MGREARDGRDRRPWFRPVERIELNEKHIGLRLAAAAVLLLLGAGLLAYAVTGLLTPETGWQTVQASSSVGPTCADDFTFLYRSDSTAEARSVTRLYSNACQKAFQLFHSKMTFDDVTNVCTINRHPNEVLEVDGTLYEAFSAVVGSGRRELYLGPVYERYGGVFSCQDDTQLADFDPRLSEDVRREYGEVLAYANDSQAVCLELLGENCVRLNVSEAYLAWAEEEGITRFIDFSWMCNAFIADYLAGELAAGGYTKGVLSSYDGFTRNLDDSGLTYAYPLCHRQGDAVLSPAELHYDGPMSLVRMRDYSMSSQDFLQYYTLSTGEVRTLYLDTADALCKSAIDTLVCYSREKGCAELLLEMIPVYIADDFQEDAIPALAREGIHSIYCQDSAVRYTDPDAVLSDFFIGDGIEYAAEQISLS